MLESERQAALQAGFMLGDTPKIVFSKSMLRVQDAEAAVTVVFQAIEAVIHNAVMFGCDVSIQRLLDNLAEMTVRFLFDE